MLVLKGEELKNFVKLSIGDLKYRRVEVKKIYNNLKKYGREYIQTIVGDRRMGKTTVMLQTIDFINKYDRSLFFSLAPGDSLDDVFKVMMENQGMLVFIDEITVERSEAKFKLLYDYYSKFQVGMVVTGTYSQIFYYYDRDILFGRQQMVKLYPITPNDYKDFLGKNIYEFVDNGGFIQNTNKDIILNDTLDNVATLMDKIDERYSRDNSELAYVFALLHRGVVSKKNYSSFLRTNSDKIFDICDLRNIEDKRIKYEHYKNIIGLLTFYNLCFKRYNVCDFEDVLLIPTNILSLEKLYKIFNFYEGSSLSLIKGDLFEKYLLQEVHHETQLLSSIAFARDGVGREIDIVDKRRNNLIEVKFSDFYRTSWNKHLTDKEFLKKYGLNDFKKIGVYLGDTFETEFGVTWMNIYDFMKHINREHLLEKVEEDKLVINISNQILSWD